MLKLVFSISIVLVSTYIGFAYGDTFRKRKDELKEILKALTILENDIVYGTTPLPESLENLSNKVGEPIAKFVKAITDRLIKGDVESVYEGALEEFSLLENEFYLYDEDKKIMSDFLSLLGNQEFMAKKKYSR